MVGKRFGPVALALVLAGCGSGGSTKSTGTSGAPADPGAPRGLVADGTATQKVRADLAFVVVEPENSGGSISFPPSSAADPSAQRAGLLARLRTLGLPDTALHMENGSVLSSGVGGETRLRVEVPVAKLPGIASDVSKAIDAVMGTTDVAGLRFAVEDCAAALSTARVDAVKDARRHAEGLARAADVVLGQLRGVTEGPSDPLTAAYFAALGNGEPCGRSAIDALSVLSTYGPPPQPLDAKPEVELTFSVSATFALADTADRTLTATGTGEVTGKADRAEIVVAQSTLGESISSSSSGAQPTGSGSFTPADGDRITRALTALGVREDAVEVEAQGGRLRYVSATVPVDVLMKNGSKIVDAVNGVTGVLAPSGVLFISSACDDLVAQARARAMTDADKRLAGLARAAKVRSGPIVGLVEPRGTVSPFATPPDPCDVDLESLSSGGQIGDLLGGSAGLPGVPKLEAIDAEPKVTQRVSVTEVRAITG